MWAARSLRMKPTVLSTALLLAMSGCSSCKHDHSKDLPSQTTTTGADMPGTAVESKDGGAPTTPMTMSGGGEPASAPADTGPASAPADPGRAVPLGPVERGGAGTLVPRSGSAAEA